MYVCEVLSVSLFRYLKLEGRVGARSGVGAEGPIRGGEPVWVSEAGAQGRDPGRTVSVPDPERRVEVAVRRRTVAESRRQVIVKVKLGVEGREWEPGQGLGECPESVRRF